MLEPPGRQASRGGPVAGLILHSPRKPIGAGPAGAISSNLEDLSRWVIALLNGGVVDGRQVLPASVLKETLAPAIALPNADLEAFGWSELLNVVYGTGRITASYRGHLLSFHGGDLSGFRCPWHLFWRVPGH